MPDGTYEFLGDTIRILNAPQRSVEQLQAFAAILQQAFTSRTSRDAIVDATRTHAPELEDLAHLLPEEASKLWLTVIVLLVILSRIFSVNFNVNVDISLNLNDAIRALVEAMADDAELIAGEADDEEDDSGPHYP